MQNNKQQPKSETKLRIQSSVYPEGYGTMEHFNSAWQNIYAEAEKAVKDLRHYASPFNRMRLN